ncbi:MAG: hypothetical protein AB1758_15095 [Candidatus Eremiobacterota bacterium]
MNQFKGYIVRKEDQGSAYFVLVSRPGLGDEVCHGSFEPDASDGSGTRYRPLGRVRSEFWGAVPY